MVTPWRYYVVGLGWGTASAMLNVKGDTAFWEEKVYTT